MDGLWADRALMDSNKTQAEWADLIGESPRTIAANLAAPEWREVSVFDSAGIYLLREKKVSRTLSVLFVWDLGSVPYPPKSPFSGRLLLNGVALTTGMREKDLPMNGPIGLVKSVGNRYAADFGEFHISLELSKRRASGGLRGVRSLARAEFDFSSVGMPPEVVIERLRRN